MLLFVAAAFADCSATTADVQLTLEDAEAAFGRLDIVGFRAATDQANADVKCLREVAPRPLAARLHRLEGLRWWADGDLARAHASFAAARAIEPGFAFPEALVPPGHPVLAEYAASDPLTGGETRVPAPEAAVIWFDGRAADSRPDARATLAQLVATSGDVRASALLWPGEALFPYDVARPVKKGPNLPFSIAAGVTLAAGAVCYGLAAADYDTFHDPNTASADLPGLQNSTNALYFSSIGAGVLALGSGVGAVVAGHW
ncbi:hypothetical protein LBMAG42_26270 [Deltaproteobacteria bacterium]|nr:hypothetical protein LBMAG42_26270 [Deltaproteobacteria bacterium]